MKMNVLRIDNKYDFLLSEEQMESLDLYIKEYKNKSTIERENKRNSILRKIDQEVDNLLSNEYVNIMLTNFMSEVLKDQFIDLTLFTLFEDKYKLMHLNIEVNRKYHIKEFALKRFESQLDNIIKIFNYRKLYKIDKELKYFILLYALKKLSLDLYSEQFHNQYHGYFINNEHLSYEDCIKSYFLIDFIEHEKEENIQLFTYYLIKNDKLQVSSKQDLYFDGYYKVSKSIQENKALKDLLAMESRLLRSNIKHQPLTIADIDLMGGEKFESFIIELFRKMGYSTMQTKRTGDQGIDVIAVKNGLRMGIQAKCYNNSVSNKAIQEVSAGIKHYQLDKGLVITNNFFTNSAKELAESNDIILWDRNLLKIKLDEILVNKVTF